jgi:uncharacterized membrane protein YbhN (UPF0104 family)
MVLIIRPGLLNHERTKIPAAVASVFVETMTMMAVGAFIATIIVIYWFRQDGHASPYSNWLTILSLAVMCGTMLPILPPIFHFVAKKCPPKYRGQLEGLGFRTLAVGWMLNIPVWFMLGTSLWLTMQGLGMQSTAMFHDLMFCTLTVSMAVVFGFVTPIPGGFGARELVILLLLAPFYTRHPQTVADMDPEAMAIAVGAVYRIVSILSELTVSALLARRWC